MNEYFYQVKLIGLFLFFDGNSGGDVTFIVESQQESNIDYIGTEDIPLLRYINLALINTKSCRWSDLNHLF